VRIDVPLMIGASVLTLLLALDGKLGAFDGLLFLALMAGYTGWTIRASRRERRAIIAEYEREFGTDDETPDLHNRWPLFVSYGLMVAGGLFLLVKGSDWLVEGASAIAVALGFSELIIGLTIVALGTSLPELATSAVAGMRGERDIAVGNAVGSNIFNILAVLGVTALVADGGVPVAAAALGLDIPIMIAVAIACLPVFYSDYVIDRWSGALFVALYTGYMTYLVMQGTQHASVAGFGSIMLLFVIPLVSFTLVLLAVRSWRRR
jgi:cation:H+ antiporter